MWKKSHLRVLLARYDFDRKWPEHRQFWENKDKETIDNIELYSCKLFKLIETKGNEK
jgi:hypothetical protein